MHVVRGIKLACFLTKRIVYYRIFRKLTTTRDWVNFAGRRDVEKKVNSILNTEIKLNLSSLPRLKVEISSKDKKLTHISVMGKRLMLSENIFLSKFEDFEKEMCLHRFAWIFDVLIAKPSKEQLISLKNLILLWINSNELIPTKTRDESYSIGERLNSWIFFMSFTQELIIFSSGELKSIENSIKRQLVFLINNVEYHGEYTNNHILNNGKALYIAGSLLHNNPIQELGKDILQKETPLIFEDGFYTENSTHYQMLYLKNYLEISLVATHINDVAFSEWLRYEILRMKKHCHQFQSRYENANSFPLFGDISPDLSIKWFLGFPFSPHKKKSPWFVLFKYDVSEIKKPRLITKPKYRYLHNGKFEVWVWLKTGTVGEHGHNDHGQVCIFYNGIPLLVDSGRGSYVVNSRTSKQVNSEGHNIPVVNGSTWDIEKPSFLTKNKYYYSTSKVLMSKPNEFTFELTSWDERMILERNILVEKNKVQITDSWKSIQKRWNLNIKLGMLTKKSKIDKKKIKSYNIIFRGEEDFEKSTYEAEYSPDYGLYKNCKELVISSAGNKVFEWIINNPYE